MVVYDNVSKFFPVRIRPGQKDRPELMVALDRINASVRKGELVTLLGPSGCGKTTLLRLTAGLIAADEGAITIAGAPVMAPRKDACMVFQNFGLLPWRTVRGNVEFPLEIDGVGVAERRDRARHFIALVGLAAFAEHFPHELSGGMQQRVGIARALMTQAHSHFHGRAIWRAGRPDPRAAAGGLPPDLVAHRRDRDFRHPQHRRGAVSVRSHLRLRHRAR
jgi:NitT/TauT family transport system ATP-binding protein